MLDWSHCAVVERTPGKVSGAWVFKGTRVPVDTILTFLAKGYSVDQLLRSWPELARPAVEEAIHLASESLQNCYVTSLQAVEAVT